ncbi:MAG TPA: S8 family serine peptidase [Flavobacteriales bacterium]
MKSLLLSLVLFLHFTGLAQAQMAIVPGDVLVMLAPEGSPEQVVGDMTRVGDRTTGLQVVREVSAPMRTWLLHYTATDIPQEMMLRALRKHPHVQVAQSNHIIKERAVPNDAQYGQQWHHQNIHSEDAWDITTGGVTATGDTIVVCIIERADLGHADLAGNAWVNRNEIPGNGVDDDGNGYIDDVRGWNPGTNNDNVYAGGHGTQVAGMIGAQGNNGIQVAGANWNVKMMPVHYTSTQEAAVLSSYTYPLVMRRLYNSSAGEQGAFIVATNASWGIDYGDPEDAPLWCAMYDTLGTAGVLNCGATANSQINVDVDGDLPTACASDFMVSVTATNTADVRTFSAYGATTIDVGAPGDNVFTTALGGGTTTTSGTSFASPLTAGVIALLYSAPCASMMSLVHADPAAGALHVREALLEGVDPVAGLNGFTVTGGRINAYNSLMEIMDQCGSCPLPYDLAAAQPAIGTAVLSWGSAVATTFNLRYRPVGASTWVEVTGLTTTGTTLEALEPCTPYEYQLASDCDTVTSDYSPSFLFTSEGCCSAPLAGAVDIDSTSITLEWNGVLAAGSYTIRHRPVGATAWTELTSTEPLTIIEDLASCTEHEVQLRSLCGGEEGEWSTALIVQTTGCGACLEGEFCTQGAENTEYEWIESVVLGDIDHDSGNNEGYADFTATQGTELVIGASYPMVLTPGFGSFSAEEWFSIFVDFDEDGDFAADETLFAAEDGVDEALITELTIPPGTPQGRFRMRITMQYDNAITAGCTGYEYGETEDYCVTFVLGVGVDQVGPNTGALLYPVPADDRLTLVLPTSLRNNARIHVMDAEGRLVMERSFTGQRLELSTAALASGTYLYRVLGTEGEAARGRFAVAR